ncbi:hypothetical protein INR49_003643 [Caranx melampygus]|nr:hypothetical protein INR49_003643 [Caranx melampygus]
MPKKAKKGGGGKMGGDESLKRRAQTKEEMAKEREETLTQCLRVTQMFENQMDGLDCVIENLVCDLQQKARQSTWGCRMHLQHLGRLWGLHEKQMMIMQQHWETGMQQLSSEFYSMGKQMLALSQKESVQLEGRISTMEQQYKEMMNEIHMLYRESIDMYKSAAEEQGASSKPQKKLEEAVQFCLKKEEGLNKFINRGQQDIERAAEDMKKIELLKHSLIQSRKTLNKNKTRNLAEEQDLTSVRAEVNKKANKLSQQLNESRSVARKQLVDLSAQSDKATKKLQAVITKGERVLCVGEMCQKLESKHKEALSSLLSAADSETSVTEREEPGQTSEFQKLQKLIGRMETAVLFRDTLKKQKQVLRQENQQLRLQVHQQMDRMSISNDTIDGHHTLLTVLQASSVPVLPSPPRPVHKQLVQKKP